MRLGKVDFPEPVVAAARNRKLVVFAGAGVSMGEPAGLPGFRALTEKIAEQSGESELDIKKALDGVGPPEYLGRIESRGTDVHALAAEELSKPGIRYTELHRVLLSLYPGPEAVRVVTTNFDRLFEQAAGDVFPASGSATLESDSFPKFPAGRDFRSIVHLHGDVARPSGMVLTDKDFGAAYLGREPQAQRFVIDLLSMNTLLFVGYSGGDVIFRYLTRGLSLAGSPRHFVMTRAEDEQAWRELGIEPVFHPTSPEDSEGVLCESISRLAAYAGESVVEQRSRIQELASRPPSELNREQIDLVADALSDAVRRKFFIHAADSPEWVAWLDERGYLDAFFRDEDLSESDYELARWLARSFVSTGPEELFALINKHKIKLHRDFWLFLLQQAGSSKSSPVSDSYLARWVSLLLSAAPSRHTSFSSCYLLFLGEHCIERGLTDSVVEIFEAMSVNQLTLPRPLRRSCEGGEADLSIGADFSPAADSSDLDELWRKGLLPKLPQVVNRLLPAVVENLVKQHRALSVWGNANRAGNPITDSRSAIEPHDQDQYRRAIDTVIDAARDCLQWLGENEQDAALHWWRQLAKEQAPILRRLAAHMLAELSSMSGLGPDKKIDMLLSCGLIDDVAVHHEVSRAMRLMYPHASRQSRQAVISAVLALQGPSEKDPDGVLAAHACFNWLHWLHCSDHDCDLARKARDQVLAEYPNFSPSPHPDFLRWSIMGGTAEFAELPSSCSAEQLLAEPAERWVPRLTENHPEGFPLWEWEQKVILERVAEAAKKSFNWGADLADALIKNAEWKTDLWDALLLAWAEADEHKILERRILRHLSQSKLRSEHPAAIASLLYAWARSGRHVNLLDDAGRVAMELWSGLPRDTRDFAVTDGVPDWMATAITRPSGILAQFWLECLHLGGPRGECRAALSAIACGPGMSGRLGRTVLAYGLPMLLDKEKAWVQDHLLPFFEWHKDKDIEDCQAVWEGFLCRSYIDGQIFDLVGKALLSITEQLQHEHCFLRASLRVQFLRLCARIVTDKHLVPAPLDKWLPSILRNCDRQDIAIFITEIGQCLEKMAEEEREESWHRWLKKYWRLRRHRAIAGYLTEEETIGMFRWLPRLRGSVFSEAVDLAEQTSPIPCPRHGFLFRELDEAGLWKEQPEAVARLILCLDKAEPPRYAWERGGKLIRKLLTLDIPVALRSELENLAVRRDISVAEGSVA